MIQEELKILNNPFSPLVKSKICSTRKSTKICIGTITGSILEKVVSIRVNGRKLPLINTPLTITSQVKNGEVLELLSMLMDPNIKAKVNMVCPKAKDEKLSRMVTSTTVSGKMVKKKVRALTGKPKELSTMAIG